MQKIKRKSTEGDASSPKKKKVQFDTVREVQDIEKGEKVKKAFIKPKKDFKKGGKTPFNKPGLKGKHDVSKGNQNKVSKNQDPGEKPKWSEMKKEKKNLRLERRKAKATAEIFEISHKAKLLAAQIQRKVIKPDFKITASKELHSLIKGQYKAIALTHDLSRVIQVLLKHSTENIKKEITEELMDIMVPMMQSKYAHHSVKRILKYGTNFIRHEVIKKMFGHVVSLATHTISAPVLDYAYGEFASKKEKLHMQQEFYGDMYKNTKDDKVKTLSDTYKDSPEMKSAILQSCKANIQRILDKNLHDGELFHSVLYDYMRECSNEDRVELISTLSPLIVPLSNSLPGANAACICVWQGTNKDKKAILKVVKEHVIPLSKHKTGYRLLLAIFDSVDDTVLVKKTIVSTLATNIQDVASDQRGNMTLHWLVKPKDSTIFHPGITSFLEDGFKSGTSKKDPELRISELREAILPALKSNIEEDPKYWFDKARMPLVVAVLSIETSKSLLQALATVICDPNWVIPVPNKDTTVLAIEDAGIHMSLKKLAALDKTASDTLGEAVCENISDETVKTSKSLLQALATVICDPNWVIPVPNKDTTVLAIEDAGIHMSLKKLAALDKTASDTLGEAVCENISDETLQAWLSTNRGCFFILTLIENNKENVSGKLKNKIKPYINILKQKSVEGAKLLIQSVQK
ncbi:jg20478 [Pararge aegeria aegeria]|uniref:Jg20478 protein n=1 Tax=Pararge aegeria aegeria TaxID=348720 RepID=A0A8S4RTX2_9NEOP|nr:jg20478 [Pararge aegeria aegeria]